MIRQHLTAGMAVLAAGFSAVPALSNDGGISFGGSPGLLSGHPSVRMESEVVRMEIHNHTVKTAADFTFVNSGRACRVRMGFPDQGEGADDPDEEAGPNVMKQPARTTFTSFVSYVNGRQIPTRLIRADQPGQFWHAKTVTFPAHGRLHIRDDYTQPVSGAIAMKGSYQNVRYVVHTGSSWHGTIGRTTIIVRFYPTASPARLTAQNAGAHVRERDWTRVPRGRIFYSGLGKPTVSGRTLRFERRNWRPTESDDLTLYFRD